MKKKRWVLCGGKNKEKRDSEKRQHGKNKVEIQRRPGRGEGGGSKVSRGYYDHRSGVGHKIV